MALAFQWMGQVLGLSLICLRVRVGMAALKRQRPVMSISRYPHRYPALFRKDSIEQ
jgi:hypothetical protein